METPLNTTLFTIVSNIFRDSAKRLVCLKIEIAVFSILNSTNTEKNYLSSTNTWSYSEDETRKRMEVTESKHWNHFCLCDLWPPTSTNRNGMLLICIINSEMPLVALRAWRMSWLLGWYSCRTWIMLINATKTTSYHFLPVLLFCPHFLRNTWPSHSAKLLKLLINYFCNWWNEYQLEFSPPVIGLSDSRVHPQSFDGGGVILEFGTVQDRVVEPQ